ncbi:uncharacterized protein JN550_007691 [Neoarthrinium moseri]|uniref:uncharacterized protein n=1 Tax=Neoarthrinium moseri TaxID=1658444 RepID=UPI001FDD19E6|nr:uncharacterized protein JN550_007691 [Neoarthrinium moseri]KAI1866303.1 hypothetical protein JN550_007691 [Neoarthrinium moseri]
MIHVFQYGLNYPIPRGWPTPEVGQGPYAVESWDDAGERRKWRGVYIVLHELARQEHPVVEFRLDANGLNTALNCRMFERPCQEYDDFGALLGRRGFRYLELSLLADAEDE